MRVIDSHTGGEPTRVVIEGAPDLGLGSLAEKASRLWHDHRDLCDAILLEPRGHPAMVAALLLPRETPVAAASAIFFNQAGPLGMCGHATIGLAVTLAHLGRVPQGAFSLATPVGTVDVALEDAATVTVRNVESYRRRKDVEVGVPGWGVVSGDVAWGGNWFFLTADVPTEIAVRNARLLSDYAGAIRTALDIGGVTGRDGAVIDHVELCGPPLSSGAQGRNFVLCPDDAYDRSPCGTGCSAKIACLAADGRLAPGQIWVQESVIGSTYALSYAPGSAGGVIPSITGRAYVTADTRLLFDAADPFRFGIPA